MQLNLNLSLLLNIVFLTGVAIAIFRTWRVRRGLIAKVDPNYREAEKTPTLSLEEANHLSDDLILTRKIEPVLPSVVSVASVDPTPAVSKPMSEAVMIFLLAKEQRQFAGYALLQTLLSAGLRFGEGDLFHRHQSANGQGLVLFSLASATASGVFDLQNMGAFSVKGLCLFMHASGNVTIDEERFNLMIEVACQLTEELDAYMLDDRKQVWTAASAMRYQKYLQLVPNPEEAPV